MKTKTMRLTAVQIRLLPIIGKLRLLDERALRELDETLEYLLQASSERRRKQYEVEN